MITAAEAFGDEGGDAGGGGGDGGGSDGGGGGSDGGDGGLNGGGRGGKMNCITAVMVSGSTPAAMATALTRFVARAVSRSLAVSGSPMTKMVCK